MFSPFFGLASFHSITTHNLSHARTEEDWLLITAMFAARSFTNDYVSLVEPVLDPAFAERVQSELKYVPEKYVPENAFGEAPEDAPG